MAARNARVGPTAAPPIQPPKSVARPRHFILPPVEPDFSFGVLRRSYDGMTNNLVEFAWAKLHPMQPRADPADPHKRVWSPTASRVDTVLPPNAADPMRDPRLLLEAFEDQAMDGQKDLAVHLKLLLPGRPLLHVAWERARSFVYARLVVEHELPAIMTLHVPELSPAKAPGDPHIHVLVLARVLRLRGFGAFCTIARDEAQVPLAAAWARTRGG